MKRISIISLMTIFLFNFSSCDKEEVEQKESNTEGAVQFSFGGISSTSRRLSGIIDDTVTTDPNISVTIKDVSAILITLKDNNGTIVKNREKIDLYNFSGKYISDPLSLPVGTFSIEEFLVVNDSMDVIYVTPLANSNKANFVTTPLPQTFSIFEGNVSKTTLQVMETEGVSPDEFGYATFDFEVVETVSFYANAFIYDSSSNNLFTDSLDYAIVLNGDSVFSKLSSGINLITIPKVDEIISFEFIPLKSDYELITELPQYTLEDLQQFVSSNPLKLIFVQKPLEDVPLRISGNLVNSFESHTPQKSCDNFIINDKYYIFDDNDFAFDIKELSLNGSELSSRTLFVKGFRTSSPANPVPQSITSLDGERFFVSTTGAVNGAITFDWSNAFGSADVTFDNLSLASGLDSDREGNVYLSYFNSKPRIRVFNNEAEIISDFEEVGFFKINDLEVVDNRIFTISDSFLIESAASGIFIDVLSLPSRENSMTSDDHRYIYYTSNAGTLTQPLNAINKYDIITQEIETIISSTTIEFNELEFYKGKLYVAALDGYTYIYE